MSLRTSNAIGLFVLLAACGEAQPDLNTVANAEVDAKADAAASGDRIDCAVADANAFANDCTVERVSGKDGLILIVRQPDGGFHRLRTTRDGRGVVAADGAEPAVVKVLDAGRIEVAIGGARYRLPATVGPLPKP